MEKEIYTKQELVDKAVENCKAVIRARVSRNGYITLDEYISYVLCKIDALFSLDIIDYDEWINLNRSMEAYWHEQNELGAEMIYKENG